MKLRVTDALSAAIEFKADSARSFRRNLNRAVVDLRREINPLKLCIQIWVERREEWGSPNYPNGNHELLVEPLINKAAAHLLWSRLCEASKKHDEFARGLEGLTAFVSETLREPREPLKRIK
jgi:hypothetical protein